jgi:lipopolysaccharide export system protein LptA
VSSTLVALALAVTLAPSSRAPAPSALTRLPAAGGGEIVLSGENVSGRHIFREHRTEFTGTPVKLVRGDATLTCKRLTAQQNEADVFQWATCQGDVHFVRGDRSITCEKATYDDPAARLTCEGNPELRSGKTVLTGKRLVYDLTRDEATLEGITGTTPSADADAQLRSPGGHKPGGPKDAQEKSP